MTEPTRRHLLRTGAAAASAAPAAALAGSWRDAARAAPRAVAREAAFDPVPIGPDDPRYRSLALRGYNHRFASRPGQIRLVGSTEDVVRAVDDAVRTGRRVVVRSGGHCFEDFVDHPSTDVVVDMASMREVGYDRGRDAFFVEAGATLGEAYRALFLGWGVTVPGGTCPGVGAGGHVAGGGYGALCRLYGLSVDHLYAVEVVVADRSGRARSVVATRERSDPHRDLWWAHTGAGGGNFGDRHPLLVPFARAARGADPGDLLPRPPATVLSYSLDWRWADLDETAFVILMRNYGRWGERNSAPDSPAVPLYGEFVLAAAPGETIGIAGQVAAEDTVARRLLDDLEDALSHGVGTRPERQTATLPWLAAAMQGSGGEAVPLDSRMKIKSGYRRRGFTDRQLATIHRYLTEPGHTTPYGHIFINTYGGRVNAVSPSATAMPHRDSVFLVGFLVGWQGTGEDARYLRWVRELYGDVYAASGGVPASEDDGGTFINYPDNDLADPRHNTSGTPWHELYFQAGYPRLQRVKRRWDPHNVFHHALSIRPTP